MLSRILLDGRRDNGLVYRFVWRSRAWLLSPAETVSRTLVRMFELEVQGLRHWRLRLGRWHFRTWRPPFMRLPRGYRTPELVYQVVSTNDETDLVEETFGAFGSESEARRLLDMLQSERDRKDLAINFIAVHASATDWQFDR